MGDARVSHPILRFLARCAIALSAIVLALAAVAWPAWSRSPTESQSPDRGMVAAIALADMPPEGRRTVVLIHRGGPYPYERDGAVFGNFERALPGRERGYYREYTVPTPGVSHRGARRIVAGRSGELYYTDDHYRTFRRIRE